MDRMHCTRISCGVFHIGRDCFHEKKMMHSSDPGTTGHHSPQVTTPRHANVEENAISLSGADGSFHLSRSTEGPLVFLR